MNNLGLTEEQVSELLHENDIWDEEEENIIYKFIDKKYTGHYTEKGRVDFIVTIENVETKKRYKAELSESPWYRQHEFNSEQTWEEIKK